MNNFQVNNSWTYNPQREQKEKKEKQSKTKKQKKEKPPKLVPPKPEPEAKKELTDEEFIDELIEEKEKIIDKKFEEIRELHLIIDAFKLRQNDDILLNERRVLVSKAMASLPKNKKKNMTEEQIEEHYKLMIEDIKKYDRFFKIDFAKLATCDLRY